MMINEVELAERWNLSPKTLQRRRITEGVDPQRIGAYFSIKSVFIV